MAKVISVCNQKGGVGKTTTAVNTATYLAIANKKVLLIDIDPQANATSGLGIDKATIEKSVYDVLVNDVNIVELVHKTVVSNLTLIPSNVALTGAEVELVPAISREYKLTKALTVIKEQYDFIIIDCPPSLGLLTINALAASDSILIPIQCEYYALEGLSQLLNTINLIKTNLNPKLDIEGVLLTMADYRTNLTEEVIQEARNFFKGRVYETVIPRNVKLSEAPSFGKPIHVYAEHSIGARMYSQFSKEMLGEKITNSENTPQDSTYQGGNISGG
ncbi:MAG: ParA family protein [Candidatus Omnitrophica bacterium]|nr:ParA family protein [Candidatus Omnitrophota bacterium]